MPEQTLTPTLPEPFARLDLPARADPLSDPSILTFLRDHQSQPVQVDASRLRHPSAPLVETLLVAAAAWREKELPFHITGLSPAHESQLRQLGLAPYLGLDPTSDIPAPDKALTSLAEGQRQ